jgi:outer membrane protein assembly factor BamB
MGPNIHAGFVFWSGFPSPSKGRLYALAEKEVLKALQYDASTGHVDETPVAVNTKIRIPNAMPGGALSISSDGGANGILWVSKHDVDAMMRVQPGHFYAVDATDLKILWQDANIEYFAKFNAPTVADGKVFLPTWGKPPNDNPMAQARSAVLVYGLKP